MNGRRLWFWICKHFAPQRSDLYGHEPHWFWTLCRWLKRHDILASIEGDLFTNGFLKWPDRMVGP